MFCSIFFLQSISSECVKKKLPLGLTRIVCCPLSFLLPPFSDGGHQVASEALHEVSNSPPPQNILNHSPYHICPSGEICWIVKHSCHFLLVLCSGKKGRRSHHVIFTACFRQFSSRVSHGEKGGQLKTLTAFSVVAKWSGSFDIICHPKLDSELMILFPMYLFCVSVADIPCSNILQGA